MCLHRKEQKVESVPELSRHFLNLCRVEAPALAHRLAIYGEITQVKEISALDPPTKKCQLKIFMTRVALTWWFFTNIPLLFSSDKHCVLQQSKKLLRNNPKTVTKNMYSGPKHSRRDIRDISSQLHCQLHPLKSEFQHRNWDKLR